MRTFGVFCLVLLLGSAPAAGRNIFVDNATGDDRSAGLQPRNAVDQGDRVYFDENRAEGGLDEFQPAVDGENQP